MTRFDPTPRPALRAPSEGDLRPAPDRHHHPALPREVHVPHADADDKADKKTVSIKVKVPKSVRKQLKDLADRQGISIGELLAKMVARELRD